MNQPTICTIISKNYLAHARVLANTFLQHHPDGRIFVLLVDELDGYFDPDAESFTLILARDLNIPDFQTMAFRYTILELNTAVKPFFLEHLFTQYGCQQVCYFDPDITINHPLDEIFNLLKTHLMVLVPHLLDFLEDGHQPDEPYILRAGVYNLGFIGVARHPELNRFLHWWQRRLRKDCLVDPVRGLFTDQRWMDLAPGFFDDVCIHRDPGCDVAYWNLNHRTLEKTESGYSANGSPLKFFHFSGFSVNNVEIVSKHQDRFTLSDLPQVRPLYEAYRVQLLKNGYDTVKHWPYAYNYFDNQVKIPDTARYIWRETDQNQLYWPTPSQTNGPDDFIQWLNQSVDGNQNRRPLLTRLALEIYQSRIDIQQAFPDILRSDRRDFAKWFVTQAADEHHIDEFFIKPVADSLKTRTIQNSTPSPQEDESQASILVPADEPDDHLHLGAKTYLQIRDMLNRIGLGQRIRAIVGPEQVLKIRQTFFYGNSQNAQIYAASGPVRANPIIAPNTSYKVKKPGLNVVGYLRDETGVGEVARSILKALHRQDFPVAQTSIDGYSARANDTSVLHIPKGHPHSVNLINVNADQVPIVYEGLGSDFFKEKYNIGFWFWELSQFPDVWLDSLKYFNEIWVGSSFIQATLAPVAPIPVVNMRVPIIKPTPSSLTRTDLGLPVDKHIFLFTFDGLSYIERKNPFALIEAYRQAFEPHFADTALVIKVTNLDKNPEMAQLLRREMSSISGILINRYMTRNELNGLFQACDTYVSLHRSEGFGMTIAETMAIGKPVIATAYSANMDFMTPANSYPVAYRLVELEQNYGPYKKGNFWANPNIDDAAALMQQVASCPEEARKKGQLAQVDIEQFYGVESVAQNIVKRLERILTR